MSELAQGLGVTETAIRQHLQVLEGRGLARRETRQGGVGRPALVWSLTARSQQFLPHRRCVYCVTSGKGGEEPQVRSGPEGQGDR